MFIVPSERTTVVDLIMGEGQVSKTESGMRKSVLVQNGEVGRDDGARLGSSTSCSGRESTMIDGDGEGKTRGVSSRESVG